MHDFFLGAVKMSQCISDIDNTQPLVTNYTVIGPLQMS